MSDSKDSNKTNDARKKEIAAMLERRFQHTDRKNPVIKLLFKEARRHWMATLEDSDDD